MRGQVKLIKVTLIGPAILLSATGLSCGLQGPTSHQSAATIDAKRVDDTERPSLGTLEHRGTRYELRDLFDPAYRAASEDPFARDFDPLRLLAAEHVALPVIWAGLGGACDMGIFSTIRLDAASIRTCQSPWNP